MRGCRIFFITLLAPVAAYAAIPVEPTSVLLRGTIVSLAPLPADENDNEALVATPVRIHFRVRTALLGTWRKGKVLDTTVPMTGLPAPGRLRDIYLLMEPAGSGWKPINWDYAKSGICISRSYAKAHGFPARLEGLRKAGVISCDRE